MADAEYDYDLFIAVYACDTIPLYRSQIALIEETYGALILAEFPKIKMVYFLGDQTDSHRWAEDCHRRAEDSHRRADQTDCQSADLDLDLAVCNRHIHLPGVKNDYLSASYKQWNGMKYAYENIRAKFSMYIGTDTYLNVRKLAKYLAGLDPARPQYIGGHGGHIRFADKDLYFHSGGPGFVLSAAALALVYPRIRSPDEYVREWTQQCSEWDCAQLVPACDVAIAHLIDTHFPEIEEVIDDCAFINCTHEGWPCHHGQIDVAKVCACHNMNSWEFERYTKLLEDNHGFV